jgi:RNA polymerase sigma-70 factor, ECF subfamily
LGPVQLKKLDAYAEQRGQGNVTVLDPEYRKKALAKQSDRARAEVYLSAIRVEFYSFDENYLRLLRQGDRATQEHFVAYFTRLLRIKLRSRKLTQADIEDVHQETLLRVLVAVRTKVVQQPERLGPYVNSVCNNVLHETYRGIVRNHHVDLDSVDVPDCGADLEGGMIAKEKVKMVHKTLDKLTARDQTILRAVLQGRDKDQVCQELGIERGYLRVLTHRASASFKEQYKKRNGSSGTGRAAKL